MKKTFLTGLIFSFIYLSIFVVRIMNSQEIEELDTVTEQELIMQDEEVGSVQATVPQLIQYAQLYQKTGNRTGALRIYALVTAYKNRVGGHIVENHAVEQDEELND